ncbi:hypothetical protein CsatB_017089 [Cannabis sativa]|uniref:ras-related protein RIC1-like n=1 Tax=Cannabis sativa TaxID=3483 RepID=UPI0011DF536A|nr:ras-related protein RIC1-like [Cannabis sativa]XP_030491376.1 ras-related protein RIC1-like [Cannabis sativa]XP_060959043.1 ras-related protein RIC1-like [Cannabis sativa]
MTTKKGKHSQKIRTMEQDGKTIKLQIIMGHCWPRTFQDNHQQLLPWGSWHYYQESFNNVKQWLITSNMFSSERMRKKKLKVLFSLRLLFYTIGILISLWRWW